MRVESYGKKFNTMLDNGINHSNTYLMKNYIPYLAIIDSRSNNYIEIHERQLCLMNGNLDINNSIIYSQWIISGKKDQDKIIIKNILEWVLDN